MKKFIICLLIVSVLILFAQVPFPGGGNDGGGGGGGATGPAGGALTGIYPNPTLANVHFSSNEVPFSTSSGVLSTGTASHFYFTNASPTSAGQLHLNGSIKLDESNGCNGLYFGTSSTILWRDNGFCPSNNNWLVFGNSSGTAGISWRDNGTGCSTPQCGTLGIYNQTSTAGFGQPAIYASINLTGQTGSISATNLNCGISTCSAGTYRVGVEQIITIAGTSGTLQSTILWNDGTAARTESPANLTFGTTARDDGTFVFTTNGSTAIQYSTTLTSPVGNPQYSITVILERIR